MIIYPDSVIPATDHQHLHRGSADSGPQAGSWEGAHTVGGFCQVLRGERPSARGGLQG